MLHHVEALAITDRSRACSTAGASTMWRREFAMTKRYSTRSAA
jgi:hypothetical protein